MIIYAGKCFRKDCWFFGPNSYRGYVWMTGIPVLLCTATHNDAFTHRTLFIILQYVLEIFCLPYNSTLYCSAIQLWRPGTAVGWFHSVVFLVASDVISQEGNGNLCINCWFVLVFLTSQELYLMYILPIPCRSQHSDIYWVKEWNYSVKTCLIVQYSILIFLYSIVIYSTIYL